MDDCISRASAQNITAIVLSGYLTDAARDIVEQIDVSLGSLPAADVKPVMRGRWSMSSERPDTLICSVCDHAFDVWVWDHKWMHFCPYCGADMR